MWDYLKLMTLPLNEDRWSWVESGSTFTALAFVALGVAAIVLRNARLSFAFLWTLLALLPYSFFEAGIEPRYTYLACAPFTLFLMLWLDEAVTALTPRLRAYPAALPAGGALLLALVVFLAAQARDRQEVLSSFALSYQEVFRQVPGLCGELPPEAHIFLVTGNVPDLYGASTRMAINLEYDRVNVGIGPLPDLAPLIEDKCVVQYDVQTGRYVRVE
jgi:hypothetical protein